MLTKDRVEQLGFVAWSKVQDLVEKAFKQKNANAMRFAFIIAQWVVIGERFDVKKAGPQFVVRP